MDRGAKRGGEEKGSDEVYGDRMRGERNEQWQTILWFEKKI